MTAFGGADQHGHCTLGPNDQTSPQDIARPLWLEKNQREWDEFGQTRFLPDAFLESVPFDRLEIEYIDPDAPKRHSNDPRNA